MDESRIGILENRISELEQKVQTLSEGKFTDITVNKLIVKEDDDNYNDYSNRSGIYYYSKENDLLYKTTIQMREGDTYVKTNY